jgi:hydrogenase-4 membrane subunit HyfE
MPHASAEIFHLLGGAVLALGCAMLACRRSATLLAVAGAPSAAVAAAAACQAWAQHSAALAGMAAAVLIGGAALPWSLLRQRAQDDATSTTAAPTAAPITAAAAIVLALLAVPSAHLPGLPPVRENLALALAATLVALLLLAARRASGSQTAGLQSLANGAGLGAAAAGAAWPEALAVVALLGFAAVGLWVRPASEAP